MNNETAPEAVKPQSWMEGNVLHPLANTAADAYNAVIYNTVGKAVNKVADKEVMSKAGHYKTEETEGLTKETVTQAVTTGVGLAITYAAAGRSAGGILRAGARFVGLESKLGAVTSVETAASLTKTVMSDKTAQLAGAVAFDGLRDTKAGETHMGNMAGTFVGFSIYNRFNPALDKLAPSAKILGHAALGAGGSGASKVVADGVSGKVTTKEELVTSMIAGGAMNTVLPGAQKLIGLGAGKINDKLGRGHTVEQDMKLNGLYGQSSTLDELSGKVASLRVKHGQESTNLQNKVVSLEGKGTAADRAHEFAHEWFLKSHQKDFAEVAKTLKGGDEVKAFMEYRQLRMASEGYAHKMEAQVAKEVGDPRKVEINSEKIGALKTPEGITYEDQWRREFERFKATDGRVVAEVDFKSVPTIAGVQSMREVAGVDPKEMKAVMRGEYYPGLKKAFPDKSEYEKISTYYEYLLDKGGTWDAVALRGSNGEVIGGIQSQVINVNGKVLKNAVWGEHIWLAPEARSFPNFRGLMNVAADRFRATGSQMAFMEFNDRAKMSLAEMIQDAKGGLTTEAREVIWGRFANKGLNILHFKDGKIAPYAQPGMDGQDPVNYLTLALISLNGKNLAGSRLPTADYLSLLTKAHGTLVDTATDPTVQAYTKILTERMAAGEQSMKFARLADTTVGRIVTQHPLGRDK